MSVTTKRFKAAEAKKVTGYGYHTVDSLNLIRTYQMSNGLLPSSGSFWTSDSIWVGGINGHGRTTLRSKEFTITMKFVLDEDNTKYLNIPDPETVDVDTLAEYAGIGTIRLKSRYGTKTFGGGVSISNVEEGFEYVPIGEALNPTRVRSLAVTCRLSVLDVGDLQTGQLDDYNTYDETGAIGSFWEDITFTASGYKYVTQYFDVGEYDWVLGNTTYTYDFEEGSWEFSDVFIPRPSVRYISEYNTWYKVARIGSTYHQYCAKMELPVSTVEWTGKNIYNWTGNTSNLEIGRYHSMGGGVNNPQPDMWLSYSVNSIAAIVSGNDLIIVFEVSSEMDSWDTLKVRGDVEYKQLVRGGCHRLNVMERDVS